MFFPIAIEQGSEDQSFGVIVPDIPGCFSAGDTLDEAIRNVKEAISIHLELLVSAEEAIPTAQDLAKYVNDPLYEGCAWFLVDLDISRYLGKTEKVNVSLPQRLIHLIDEKVSKDKTYKSRSAFLAAGAEKLLSCH